MSHVTFENYLLSFFFGVFFIRVKLGRVENKETTPTGPVDRPFKDFEKTM